MAESVKIGLLLITLSFAEARNSNDQLVAINDCACPGYNVTYECTVFGSAATVWRGTAFECLSTNNELVIFHSNNSTLQNPQTCNNGAITGRVIRAEINSYTSQLTVQISDKVDGTTVVCAHDNGTDSTEICSTLLNITTAPFPPPTDVQLVESNHTHLRFNWTQVLLSCPSIRYHIVASNCGQCPNTTTNTTVTCSGNYKQLMNKHQCSFAVQTDVCDGIIGDISIPVNSTMIGSVIGSMDRNESSLLDLTCVQGVSSSIIITFGAAMGATFIVLVFITSISTTDFDAI